MTMKPLAAPGKTFRTILGHERNREAVKEILDAVRYYYRHSTRTVMYRECFKLVRQLDPARPDALEISAGHIWQRLGFKSFTEANYPNFDICKGTVPGDFDLVIADQVFEHLLWPYRAGRNVYDMLAGRPLHGHHAFPDPRPCHSCRLHPLDRAWHETFSCRIRLPAGRDQDRIRGNRACVKANFKKWARRGWFGSLRNEPEFPVSVWALARKI